MRGKEKAKTFTDLLDSQQLPKWDINTNDHFAQTVDAIRKAAATCFRKSDITPTQPHISTTTLRLIPTRRHAQHARRCKDRKIPGLVRFANNFLDKLTPVGLAPTTHGPGRHRP